MTLRGDVRDHWESTKPTRRGVTFWYMDKWGMTLLLEGTRRLWRNKTEAGARLRKASQISQPLEEQWKPFTGLSQEVTQWDFSFQRTPGCAKNIREAATVLLGRPVRKVLKSRQEMLVPWIREVPLKMITCELFRKLNTTTLEFLFKIF